MVSSSDSLMALIGFEVQREIGMLKSAMRLAKHSFGDWGFLDMARLRDGWDDEVEEHMDMEKSVVHSERGGRA